MGRKGIAKKDTAIETKLRVEAMANSEMFCSQRMYSKVIPLLRLPENAHIKTCELVFSTKSVVNTIEIDKGHVLAFRKNLNSIRGVTNEITIKVRPVADFMRWCLRYQIRGSVKDVE